MYYVLSRKLLNPLGCEPFVVRVLECYTERSLCTFWKRRKSQSFKVNLLPFCYVFFFFPFLTKRTENSKSVIKRFSVLIWLDVTSFLSVSKTKTDPNPFSVLSPCEISIYAKRKKKTHDLYCICSCLGLKWIECKETEYMPWIHIFYFLFSWDNKVILFTRHLMFVIITKKWTYFS